MPDTTPTITARSGVLLVVCAPSGTGKTTLIQRLRDEFPNFAYSISCTTRAPRGHETDGKDYHFLSVEEFLRRREAGFFAEWANVHGNYYGTPLAPVLETLKAGQDVLFDIDVQGAAQLHLSLPRGQYVFLLPPSLSELERRLRGRGTDDEASIARRLSNAASEIRQAHWFDAWIVNDNLDKAYDELRAVYLASTLFAYYPYQAGAAAPAEFSGCFAGGGFARLPRPQIYKKKAVPKPGKRAAHSGKFVPLRSKSECDI